MAIKSGFEQENVHRALGTIETAYKELHEAIKRDIQNGFIMGMRDKWACTQAQVFFKERVKPQFDEITRKINENFTIITEGINEAARIWALQTQSEYTKKYLTVLNTQIDVTMIQENVNGRRGIDKEEALNLTSELSEFKSKAMESLSKAQRAITNCGFLGGQQEANLSNVLGKNKEIISDYIEAINSALNTAITNTVNAYGDTEGKIAEAFNIG